MPWTNANLVRQMAGDPGTWTRDAISGDGTTLSFYLFAPPLIGDSQVVYVDDSPLTEVASNPAAGQYTLDDATGRIEFGAAPADGTDNVVATYQAVRLTDEQVAEACRQYGLTTTDLPDTGRPVANLLAAALCADWLAAAAAGDFDFQTDGQSFSRSKVSERFSAISAALRVEARKQSGLASMPVTRLDGYSVKGEYTSRDYATSPSNPRRQFYGEEDRIP